MRFNGLLKTKHYSVLTSRGCLFSCSFCSVCAFYSVPKGDKQRFREPDNIISELKSLLKDESSVMISFVDDNFFGSSRYGINRAKEIATYIIKERLDFTWAVEARVEDIEKVNFFDLLIESGLRHVNLGIESGVQTVLDRFNKNTNVESIVYTIKKLNCLRISSYYHYIMFDSNTTVKELLKSVDFFYLTGICKFSLISNKLNVYKGTGEYEKLKAENRLTKNNFQYNYEFKDKRVDLIYFYICEGMQSFKYVEKYIMYITALITTDKELYSTKDIDNVSLINEINITTSKKIVKILEKIITHCSDIYNFERLEVNVFLEYIKNLSKKSCCEIHSSLRNTFPNITKR